MKTIGVLGGLGPQATMEFERRVHEASQRLIPQRGNSGYPPMVVMYMRDAPVLLHDDGSPILPIQINPRILEVAAQLGGVADFIVITANGPHMMRAQIEEASGLKVLSMTDMAIEEMKRRGWKKVGVLGLGEPLVYLEPLKAMGIATESIDGELRANLDQAIIGLMEGRTGNESTGRALAAVTALRERGVEGVLLGCTEIPLMLGQHAHAPDLIDPGALLAEAAVRYAMQEQEG